jgi:haloalkane dehalogenase
MADPQWLDRAQYPFAPHYIDVDGGRMHYVDEGEGPPVVLVHGTPTWSFLYRRVIAELSGRYRCIAPDNIGFGLSEKPAGWGYRPEDHARNLRILVERLDLRGVTLVVHDFGGPIGLSYAVERPENVRALVLFNTWLWSLADEPSVARGARILGGPLGRVLYERLNVSPRFMMRAAWGDRSTLTPALHRHYTAPLATPRDRHSTWVLARELLGSSGWYESLWSRRDRIAEKPALLLWGARDPAFGGALGRWRQLFPHARVETFPAAGHFVQEEVEGLGATIAAFLDEAGGAETG